LSPTIFWKRLPSGASCFSATRLLEPAHEVVGGAPVPVVLDVAFVVELAEQHDRLELVVGPELVVLG